MSGTNGVTVQGLSIGLTSVTSVSGPIDMTGGTGGIAVSGAATTSAGNLIATSTGNLSLGSFAVGGTTTLTTLTNPGDISVTGASTSAGTIQLTTTRNITTGALTTTGAASDIVADATTAGVGAIAIGSANAVRDVLIGTNTRPTTLTLGASVAGRNLTTRTTGASTYSGSLSAALTDLLAGGALTGGAVSGTNGVTVVGQSVSLVSATSSAGPVALSTTAGALSVGTINAGTSITLNQVGGGDLVLGTITAPNDLTLTTDGNLRVDTATSNAGKVTATAAQSVTGQAGGSARATFLAASDANVTAGTQALVATVRSTNASVTVTGASVDALQLTAATGVTATATGASGAKIVGITTTGGAATINATNVAGTATVSGPVSVVGDYAVTGNDVVLSGTQAATGLITVTGTGGTVSGLAGLSLESNSDGTGGEALTLRTTGAAGGDIVFAPSSTLLGGTAANLSYVQIGSRAATNAVTLGTVTALGLRGAVAAAPFSNGIARSGNIEVGTVTTNDTIMLAGGNVTAGALTTTGAATDIVIDADTANTGAITVTSANAVRDVLIGANTRPNTLSLGSAIAGGKLNAFSAGDATVGSITTANGIGFVNSANGTATVTGPVSIVGDYAVSGNAVVLGSGSALTQKATGQVTITGTGVPTSGVTITGLAGLTLQSNADGAGAEALTLQTVAAAGGDIGFAPSSNLIGGTTADQSYVQIRSLTAANAVSLGTVTARGLLGAVGGAAFTNGLTRTAAITTGNVTTIDTISLTGGGVTTGALTTTGAATDIIVDVAAANTGAITIGSASAVRDVLVGNDCPPEYADARCDVSRSEPDDAQLWGIDVHGSAFWRSDRPAGGWSARRRDGIGHQRCYRRRPIDQPDECDQHGRFGCADHDQWRAFRRDDQFGGGDHAEPGRRGGAGARRDHRDGQSRANVGRQSAGRYRDVDSRRRDGDGRRIDNRSVARHAGDLPGRQCGDRRSGVRRRYWARFVPRTRRRPHRALRSTFCR